MAIDSFELHYEKEERKESIKAKILPNNENLKIKGMPELPVRNTLALKLKDIDKDSLEGSILHNKEIQTLLNDIVSTQALDWEKINTSHKNVTEEGECESWDDYKIRNSSAEKYEEFLLSEEGIQILSNEINVNFDENGNINTSQPLSYIALKTHIREQWFDQIRDQFNLENGIEDKNKDTWNRIKNTVRKLSSKHFRSGETKFSNGLIKDLTSFVNNEENKNEIQDLISGDNDEFKVSLKETIRKYAHNTKDENGNFSFDAKDDQLNLELRSYLFLYAKIFHTEKFQAINRETIDPEIELSKIYFAFLAGDNKIEGQKNNEYIEQEKRAEKERLERDKKRRIERNRRLNEHNKYKEMPDIQIDNKDNNSKETTGAEIAANVNLKLDEYKINENSDIGQKYIKESAFRLAWQNFLAYNDEIKGLLTQERMYKLYNIESNMIRKDAWNKFESRALKDASDDDKEAIYNKLSGFSVYFSDALKTISEDSNYKIDTIHETVKIQAVGSVLDNIKNIFSNFAKATESDLKSEGFKFNEKPIKQEGNNLLISGNFKGTDITLRYNLKSGELFMNSFFQWKDQSTIAIQNQYPDTSIGNLLSFENVLDEHYKMPDPPDDEDILTLQNPHKGSIPIKKLNKGERIDPNNRPLIGNQQADKRPSEPPDLNKLFNNNIDLLSNNIKEKLEFSSYKNVAICNFLKTFNMMQGTESTAIEFQRDGNVFNALQYIYNSDTDDLEYFTNEFMPYITQISGLKWGINNMSQNKRSKIFDEDFKDNKDIAYLKEKMEDFNPNLDKKNTLKFADLIKEKILNNTTAESERKLDKNKMIQFKTDLDNGMDPDRQLANALENL